MHVQLKEKADNIWAVITPDRCTVEQRWRVPNAQSYPQVGLVVHLCTPDCSADGDECGWPHAWLLAQHSG